MAPDPRMLGQPCTDCSKGPSGIAGHERLFSQTMGADHMHFRCRACGALWMRRAPGPQRFEWSRADEASGVDTPGRPGTTPP